MPTLGPTLMNNNDQTYTSLADRQIRILLLEAGFADEPICGSIEPVSLDGDVAYEALSYVWGAPQMPYRLHTAKGHLPVTVSLYSSLKCLRRREGVRALWVDAICINQNDNEEKNRQVRLMREIYQKATRVVMHLGEEYEGSQHIPQLLDAIEAGQFDSDRDLKSHLPLQNDEQWAALRAFFRRPWFRRVWVFQEFIVAVDVLVFCGDWTFKWDNMLMAIVNVSRIGVGDLYSSHRDTHEQNEATGNALTLMWWLSELRADFHRGIKHSLLGLLETFRWAEATRSHDHLFALLGIAEDGNDKTLAPDYNESFNEVVHRYVEHFLRQKNAMVLLHSAGISSNHSLPSWIPDWTSNEAGIEPLGSKLKVSRSHLYSAAGSSAMEMRLAEKNENILVLKGAIIEKIVQCDRIPNSTSGRTYDRVNHWLETLDEYASSLEQYTTGENILAVQARIFLANRDRESNALQASDLSKPFLAYRQLIRSIATSSRDRVQTSTKEKDEYDRQWEGTVEANEYPRLKQIAAPVMEAAGMTLNGRKPCLTESQYLGFVPDATMPGDLLVIFAGGIVPFIIRGPRDCGQAAGEEVNQREIPTPFQLVGECYIHGIMKGEAWETPDLQLRDIRLL